MFLNIVAHKLDTLVWMKTKDAQKKVPQEQPKLTWPSFLEHLFKPKNKAEVQAHDVDDIKLLLSKPRK